jgi:two-component system sensor histidine kinase KdpD
VVTLIVFALTAVACGFTVARVNSLRRKAEESERAAFNARLDAAVNESRAGFLAAMTHNLRTPLASIKASVETLEDPTAAVDDATRAQLLSTAHEETERLERLVTKVLELSRIHAGAIEPRLEPTDVGEITRGAVRRLRYLAARDRVRLSVADDAVVVAVDPEMVELVLVILIENALRVAPDGTEVAVVVGPEPAGGCRIEVIDHGPGIPVQSREKVFEEFVRLEGAPDQTGSGLGLAIARALVDAHGGTIGIDDTPGGGATFTVTLPDVGTPA